MNEWNDRSPVNSRWEGFAGNIWFADATAYDLQFWILETVANGGENGGQ